MKKSLSEILGNEDYYLDLDNIASKLNICTFKIN